MHAKGLEGIVVAETSISDVDGKKGELLYRGYDAGNLAQMQSFEEVAYLLLNGGLPNQSELEAFIFALKEKRTLPTEVQHLLRSLPKELMIMDVLRSCISSLNPKATWPPTKEEAIQLIALFPTIIASWIRHSAGKVPLEPDHSLNHVQNYLYMMSGNQPEAAHVSALTSYLILTMEHGMNASTFAARVVSSTESDLPSAICGALGTMKGPLHGGAPTGVLQLLSDVQSDTKSPEEIVREKLQRGEKLMGFGHRVYKTTDPRAIALRHVLKSTGGADQVLSNAVDIEQLITQLLAEYKPGRNLHVNVEYYAAAVMDAIAFKPDWFTPTFCVSRIVGWCTHVIEQSEDNRIFRPQQEYVGTRKN
ncbi:citrate synthase/methylcitrate synthase [Shouchella plakortidis]|uniref:Citrate synthase n=2 Tax=Alkalicoccobacillus plakortidis TaxID=444060 RepID=A0ABT0XK52_9BACI|nr:citrate synthase/methylcitrate synthase [Alkalicoccobacillus plakortidis]